MAKRATTKKAKTGGDDREIPQSFVMASVMPGEPASSRWNNNTGRDYEMTARGVVGTMNRAATINATTLSGCTLRLYRKTTSRASGKRYLTRRVTDGRKLKYLCGDTEIQPTRCKGANYAAKAGDGIEEVLDHPVLNVLQNPDPVYTGQIWMQAIWFQREICGRAYLWAADRVNGIPTSLYLLPSCYTWPEKSETGLIAGFTYARNRTHMMRTTVEDTVYLRHAANPFDPVGALSWTNSIVTESDLEAAALQSELARWNNGGIPGMVFKTNPQTTDPQMAQIYGALSRQVQGVGKAGSLLVLRDTDLIQYATKPHEMQYAEGMSATEKRIYDAAGVPESIYRLNSANLASATVSDTQYNKFTIAPRLATMASEFTELLLPMFGIEPGEMWFMFDNPVRDDVVALAAEYRAAEAQGIITPNEWRTLMGLEALPDDQNRLRYRQTEAPMMPTIPTATDTPDAVAEPVAEPSNATPNATDAAAATGDVQAAALNGAQVQALADLATQVATGQLPKESAQALAAAAFPLVSPETLDAIFGPLESFTPEPEPNAQTPQATDATTKTKSLGSGSGGPCKCGTCGSDGAGLHQRAAGDVVADAGTVPSNAGEGSGLPAKAKAQLTWKGFGVEWDEEHGVPKDVVSVFNRFYADVNKWYAATIPTMVNDTVPGFVDYPTQDQTRELVAISERFIDETLVNGGAFGLTQVGAPDDVTFTTANEGGMKYIRNRGLELATSVPETLKGTVQATIEKVMADGVSIDKMKVAIAEAVPELSGYQAERLARTETGNAFVAGQVEAWKEAGVAKKKWILAGGPCPICEEIAAMYPDYIPMDQPFNTPKVSVMQPLAHPNCVLPDTLVELPAFDAAMRSHYSGDVVEIQTASGRVLTVTANHPLLTDSGWKIAADINESDDLVCAFPREASTINPNVDHAVPTAEQVFKAAEVSGRMLSERVKAAAHHLHGDGGSVDGQIEIERADCGLMVNCKATFSEESCERGFKVAYAKSLHLACPGSLDPRLLALAAAANGCMSLRKLGHDLVTGQRSSHPEIGLSASELDEAKTLESVGDCLATTAEVLCESIDALSPFGVETEQVTSIIVRKYSGHVYNFSTLGNVYVSNGIVSHNCRCDLLPYVEGNDE